MQYYAVTRRGSEDELTHWKYIKKIKSKNGKMRYIYDRSELDKYDIVSIHRFQTNHEHDSDKISRKIRSILCER